MSAQPVCSSSRRQVRSRARALVASTLGLLLASAACQKEPGVQVAVTPLSRLTPQQYENTISDLLQVKSYPNRGLLSTATDRSGVLSHASVSVLDLRNYLSDAESIAKTARDSGMLRGFAPCVGSGDKAQQAACAEQFLAALGKQLFRRSLTVDELSELRAHYDHAVKPEAEGGLGLGGLDAHQFLLETLLNDPQFLYVVEAEQSPDRPARPGDVVALGPYEIAARLALFIWQSAPDDKLIAAAEEGRLATREGIAQEVKRMLGGPGHPEPRALRGIRGFAHRWLSLGDAAGVRKSIALFPHFDDSVRAAMPEETAQFIGYVTFEGDGKLRTLLTAPYSFVNAPLARIYGLSQSGFDGLSLVRTELDPSQRSGILTQPSFLATRAHSADASPTLRGLFVRQRLLCESLALPPPTADTTPPATDFTVPTRERYKEHSRNPACSGCHVRMDPVGAGFEKYDATGAYQTHIGNYVIDGVGQMYASQDLDGPFAGPVELGSKLAASPSVESCFVRQMFRFALSRYEDSIQDERSLRQITENFHDSGQDIRRLIAEIAVSDAFLYRKVAPEEGQP